jgi:Yip1 domain
MMRTFVDVMVAPNTAIETIRYSRRTWFPIVAKALAVSLLWAWYFQTIDLEWFKEQVVFAGNQIPPEARAAVDELFTRRILIVGSLVSELVLLALILAVLSTYLWFAGRDVRGRRPPFRQWVALVAWSSAPTFLVMAAMAIIVIARDGAVLPTELDPTTLNALVVGAGPTSKWAMWATSFSIVHLWVFAFIAIGFRHWTGRSWATSAAVVVSPAAIAYTLWAAWIAS